MSSRTAAYGAIRIALIDHPFTGAAALALLARAATASSGNASFARTATVASARITTAPARRDHPPRAAGLRRLDGGAARAGGGHAHRLVTGDDVRAADLAARVDGVHHVERRPDGVHFESRPEPVERLTTALGSAGIGIRQLELPTTALETLFFRLTEAPA